MALVAPRADAGGRLRGGPPLARPGPCSRGMADYHMGLSHMMSVDYHMGISHTSMMSADYHMGIQTIPYRYTDGDMAISPCCRALPALQPAAPSPAGLSSAAPFPIVGRGHVSLSTCCGPFPVVGRGHVSLSTCCGPLPRRGAWARVTIATFRPSAVQTL